jgi:hypothetical protein
MAPVRSAEAPDCGGGEVCVEARSVVEEEDEDGNREEAEPEVLPLTLVRGSIVVGALR